jgi:hypothetical protein
MTRQCDDILCQLRARKAASAFYACGVNTHGPLPVDASILQEGLDCSTITRKRMVTAFVRLWTAYARRGCRRSEGSSVAKSRPQLTRCFYFQFEDNRPPPRVPIFVLLGEPSGQETPKDTRGRKRATSHPLPATNGRSRPKGPAAHGPGHTRVASTRPHRDKSARVVGGDVSQTGRRARCSCQSCAQPPERRAAIHLPSLGYRLGRRASV